MRSADLPLVSVVIPAYNAAKYLAETIDSVLAQTYPRVEIVVIDDGSTDDTPAVLARYADRVVSKRQANAGLAVARTAGQELARGDYIAWLDADDLLEPEKLALQVAVFRQHPACSVVATDFSAFDATGWTEASHAASYYSFLAKRGLAGIFPETATISTKDLGVPSSVPESVRVYLGDVSETLIYGNCLHPPTVMTTRAAAEKAGAWEKRFGNDTDYERLLRLARTGKAAFVDRALLRYRYSDHQLSSDKNLAKISRSLVVVLEHLADAEPHRRDDPAFRRRLGEAYLRAAFALAEESPGPAARHLLRSVSTAGLLDAETTVRTALKLVLPRFAVEAYRARRRST